MLPQTIVSSSAAFKTVRAAAEVSGVLIARSIFRRRLQANGESVEEFASALQILAVECQYTSGMLNEQIRDQLIFGLKSKAIQDKIYCEKDNSVTLEEVMSIAKAGEAFQLFRFGYQHPLANKEIQDLLGPRLDKKSLLKIRIQSKACQAFVEEELGRRHRQMLRRVRWSPVPFNDERQNELDKVIGKNDLYFASSPKICGFVETFKGKLFSPGSFTGWPFFGSGIVQFNYDSVDSDEEYGIIKARDDFRRNAIMFLELFGSQVTVCTWRNRRTVPSLQELKTMLRHTPNLKHLWMEEGYHFNETKSLVEKQWPELPYLDSLHSCWWSHGVRLVEALLMAYGTKLTAFNIGSSALNIPSLIKQHSSEQSLLLPLCNVRDLSIESRIGLVRKLANCTDWKLRKLSLVIWNDSQFKEDRGKFNDFDTYVNESQLIWSLINQSSQSLEEVYLDTSYNSCGYWVDFILLFLLPVFYNPVVSTPCNKVRKLVIPALFLLRAPQVFEVLCKRFPNVKQIQFKKWGDALTEIYTYFKEENLEYADALPELARNLFFSEIDTNCPIPGNRLYGETFLTLWNGLASLQEITVVDDKYPSHVVYKQFRM